jgi:hypothetical protein
MKPKSSWAGFQHRGLVLPPRERGDDPEQQRPHHKVKRIRLPSTLARNRSSSGKLLIFGRIRRFVWVCMIFMFSQINLQLLFQSCYPDRGSLDRISLDRIS